MEEETDDIEKGEKKNSQNNQDALHELKDKASRPVFLTLISLFAFVFFGLISLFFLLALFYSGWISEVRNEYLPEGTESKQLIILLTTAGFLLHLIALTGSIMIWFRRKSGYVIFSMSTLIIATYQLFTDSISIFTLAIYISFIILFGIYYRRFH